MFARLLADIVERHLWRLAPLLIEEPDREAARQRLHSVVVNTQMSENSQTKAAP